VLTGVRCQATDDRVSGPDRLIHWAGDLRQAGCC
jgi:hypothetical protein